MSPYCCCCSSYLNDTQFLPCLFLFDVELKASFHDFYFSFNNKQPAAGQPAHCASSSVGNKTHRHTHTQAKKLILCDIINLLASNQTKDHLYLLIFRNEIGEKKLLKYFYCTSSTCAHNGFYRDLATKLTHKKSARFKVALLIFTI